MKLASYMVLREILSTRRVHSLEFVRRSAWHCPESFLSCSWPCTDRWCTLYQGTIALIPLLLARSHFRWGEGIEGQRHPPPPLTGSRLNILKMAEHFEIIRYILSLLVNLESLIYTVVLLCLIDFVMSQKACPQNWNIIPWNLSGTMFWLLPWLSGVGYSSMVTNNSGGVEILLH